LELHGLYGAENFFKQVGENSGKILSDFQQLARSYTYVEGHNMERKFRWHGRPQGENNRHLAPLEIETKNQKIIENRKSAA